MNFSGTLSSLLLSLFESSGEMVRVVQDVAGLVVVTGIDRKAGVTEVADQLARRLESYGKVDHDLFDALTGHMPQRAEYIARVRDELLPPQPTKGVEPEDVDGRNIDAEDIGAKDGSFSPPLEPEEPSGPEDDGPPKSGLGLSPGRKTSRKKESTRKPPKKTPKKPTARDRFRTRMNTLLDAVSVEKPELPDPWSEAAAVVPSFDPLALEPVGNPGKPPTDLLTRLARVSEILPDGRLSLHLRRRQEVLARLWREGRLGEVVAEVDDPSPHGRWLRRLVEDGGFWGDEPRTLEDLQTVHELGEWLALADFEPFDRNRIASLLERARRVEPLRRLLGMHFQGREKAVERLRRHAEGHGESPILVLWGVGGVGKSTLLGKVLLDMEEEGSPWVYLDFDDPEVDPLDPRKLVELLARQLGQFFAGTAAGSIFLATEAAAAGDQVYFAEEIQQGVGNEDLLRVVSRELGTLMPSPSLLVVFDTFEQVQVRGHRAVDVVRQLLDTLTDILPFARVVVSGRAAEPRWEDAHTLRLLDLDDTSADRVLVALGVEDPELRAKVIGRVGTSPLSLRLAADALAASQLGEEDLEDMVVRARRLEMQGQLYTRILGHIRDPEVRRLAHPGLIVRRVTVDVVREVLAEPCELDPASADSIFERLPRHVALFEPEPGNDDALRHRQDVREVMLRLMIEDAAWKETLGQIHDLAVEHYAGLTGPVARAEQLYHRLMRDDDPASLDALWSPELADALARCWEEPLPERARAWLGPRIGRTHGDLDAWRVEDWEVSAAREAGAHLETGDAEGALRVLRARDARSAGSRLHVLEARALARLERWDEASGVAEKALSTDLDALGLGEVVELHLLAGRAALALGRTDELRKHADRVLATAVGSHDLSARLRGLELLVDAGDETARARLEQAFLEAQDIELRRLGELAHRVLERLRPYSQALVRKVAAVFGNRSRQDVIRQDAFQLEDLLVKAARTDRGKENLSRLAKEVGLQGDGYRVRDLARQSIRVGKMGDAMVSALDSMGEADRGLDAEVLDGAGAMIRDFDGKGDF